MVRNEQVFFLLREANLKVHLEFLGHIVSQGCIQPDQNLLKNIILAPTIYLKYMFKQKLA